MLDGTVADLLLVVARTPAGVSVFAVERGAPGLTVEPLATMDQTRKQARVVFGATPARLVGAEGAAWPAVCRMLDLAAVALAAEQVGGAQRVLEMAVGYAKIRVQFGQPIGSFQAIKHKCADMFLEVESAKSAAYYAGWAAGARRRTKLPVAASLAKAYCSEAYSTRPPRTSRSTAVSASPGNIRPTCTSSGPRAASSCSVIPPTTASCSRSASASEAPASEGATFMKLEPGQVAVVTGGASGIGFALCEQFAQAGLHVVMSDVDDDSLAVSAAG